jgi:mannose-6-phosphate isomerase-like protein (cupin superfamily)
MSDQTPQLFNASFAKDAVYKTGLRSFMEYRDLGINSATHGQYEAHVIRVKPEQRGHDQDLHTTGLHQHFCDFQMVYVLNGWIKLTYEGHGEFTFGKGDCFLQPPGIVHNEIACSDDVEVLEVYSPAVHKTAAVEQAPEAVAAAH